LQMAADMAQQTPGGQIHSPSLNGLAILSYEATDCERAADLLKQAVQASPDHPYLLINQGITASALGRNQDAVTLAARAVKMNTRDPRVWAARGYLYAATGKFDESITCFSKSIELAPRVALYHAALAICYDFVERPDETARHLEAARELAREPALTLLDVYQAALLPDLSRATELARAAIRSDRLSAHELHRDPNLALLLDPEQIEELTA
jgi:Flp pilus assembly protein TadD